MSPSDMLLRIGQVAGYNNEIFIATTDQTLGVNQAVNDVDAPLDADNDTKEAGLIKPLSVPARPAAGRVKPSSALRATETATDMAASAAHEAEKTALIVGGIGVGLLALWIVWR